MGHARPQAPSRQKHQSVSALRVPAEFEFWCNENVASELEKCERQVSSLDRFILACSLLASWLALPPWTICG